MNPLINILIRTHRPQLLGRCIKSITDYNYPNLKVHIFPDSQFSWEQARAFNRFMSDALEIDTVLHSPPSEQRKPTYYYNLHCNDLLKHVSDGWYFFLDDDDCIIPGNIFQIADHLTDPDRPVICQMLRHGKPKPGDIYMDKQAVIKGRIGMPCLILHSKHKDLFTFPATEDADYLWIKTISEKLDCKFVKIPVVDAGRRSHGK